MVDTFPRPDWLFQLVLRRDAYEGIRAELDAQLQELDASRERARPEHRLPGWAGGRRSRSRQTGRRGKCQPVPGTRWWPSGPACA